MSEFTFSVLADIVAALVLRVIGIGLRKLFAWLRRLLTSSLHKRGSAILKIADSQIKELTTGRAKSTKEREEAIDYLKYDLSRQLDEWQSSDLRWRNERFAGLLTSRNTALLVVCILVFQAIGWWLSWTNTQLIVFAVLGILLLSELVLLARWYADGRKLNEKLKLILKEANRALVTLGPSLNINILELLTAIYDRMPSTDPITIQKQLRSLGFEVERSEIMRVTLSYQLRNKDEAERREIIGNILGAAANNLEAYKAIPEAEHRKIELMLLSDYIDDPYAEVRIVPT